MCLHSIPTRSFIILILIFFYQLNPSRLLTHFNLFIQIFVRIGGIYTTPTIAGSRSGGLIAQTWASMVTMGYEGYMKHAGDIIETARMIKRGVSQIEGLKILGKAEAMIVCFAEDVAFSSSSGNGVNIYVLGDIMAKKGWSLNTLQSPASMHLCCTQCHVGHTQDFLDDLRSAVIEVRAIPAGTKLTGKAKVYGMASSLPNGPINEILDVYNDVILDV